MVTISRSLAAQGKWSYVYLYADALCRQAGLLAALSRHGEALAAAEIAVPLYRKLVHDRGMSVLSDLAGALAAKADALGYLDRIDEARAAAAEAMLIRTDMLPADKG